MAYPAKIISINDKNIIVNALGEEKKVKPCPIPGLKKDDYVLVHQKMIVQKINGEEFRKIMGEYSELTKSCH